MKRTWFYALLLLGFWAHGVHAQVGSIAPYQQPPGVRRPTVSPYLNLLRPGSPAVNYYGIVRPQIDFERQLDALQRPTAIGGFVSGSISNIDPNAPVQAPMQPLTGMATGHVTQFFYLSSYYPTAGRPYTGGSQLPTTAAGVSANVGLPRTPAPAPTRNTSSARSY